MPTHYETLGLSPGANQAQIKAAYRRLARNLHPDLNPAPDAKDRFQEIQLSYEVLSDNHRREAYDAILMSQGVKFQTKKGEPDSRASEARRRIKDQLEAEELRLKAEAMMRSAPQSTESSPEDSHRLNLLLNSGKVAEAERFARQMLSREPRQPLPHAVLGDIARLRGEFDQALEHYGFAAQFEPKNPLYERKYEQLLFAQSENPPSSPAPQTSPSSVNAFGVGVFLVVAMAVYTVLAPEKPIGLLFASSWTMGTIAMLFLSGIVAGTCASWSGALAPFEVATGAAVIRVPPTLILGVLSVVSFWLACTVYAIVGHTQQTFNRSLSILLTVVGSIVVVFALAGWARGVEPALQNLAWGGNLAFLGGLIGWYVTDRLKGGYAQKGL